MASNFMQKREVVKYTNSPRLWETLLGLSLFIALFFSSGFPVVASETFFQSSESYTNAQENSVLLTEADKSLIEGKFDSNLPDPVPGEPEEQDEKEKTEKEEKEDNSDDNWITKSRDSGNLVQSLVNVQTEQFSQSLQNRKTIPLFILFQSWKSFFS